MADGKTFSDLYTTQYCNDQERHCPGFICNTSALFRIKDRLHFEDL